MNLITPGFYVYFRVKLELCGILLWAMASSMIDYEHLYREFRSPITDIDCGAKCAPYNEKGVPFCCDTRHTVPTAYELEWAYLQAKTDLWQVSDPREDHRMRSQTPPGQVLIECQGHLHCKREFRSLTCRSFPFFPYVNPAGKFLGLTYYWEYEDRCWVISNLERVSMEYIKEFAQTYQLIFATSPNEKSAFQYHSAMMRRIFGRKHRAIPLIGLDGQYYKITPHNGRLRKIRAEQLSKFGVYRIAYRLPFPDEIS